jgi:hypothetical protein
MYSFDGRKQLLEVQGILRRAIDSSAPNLVSQDSELRYDNRANRTFPLVLAPWAEDRAVLNKAITALSKNLSSQGLTVIHVDPFEAEELVVGFRLDEETHFMLGRVRHRTALGGGYGQLGIELTRVVTPTEYGSLDKLEPLTATLAVC